jgi:ssDNA-binding Zn-finger/Zn-ribbon topoisomerase 1
MLTIMICPKCRRHPLRTVTNHISGDVYKICDNYPICSYVEDLEPWIPVDLIQVDRSLMPINRHTA